MSAWDYVKRGGAALATGGVSEAYRAYANEAGRGARTAAAGAERAGQQYGQLAQDQWGRAQQGQQRGQAYLDPAWNYANQYAQNQQPGAFETNFNNLYGQAAGPGQSGAAWDYARGQLQQDPYSRQSFDNLNGYLQNPSAISGVYGSYQSPGALNAAYGQAQGTFQSPGMGQGMADQFTGQMRGPGQGEQWYQANQNAYGQPTSTARLYENNYGGYGEKGATEAYQAKYDQSQNKLDRAYAAQFGQRDRLAGTLSATEKGEGEIGGLYREAGGLARGAQATEGYAASQMPGIQQKGLHENFVESALTGDNPYYKMLEDEGSAAINQQMARRGHFESGGADIALGKMYGQMKAEKFRDMAGMTQSAQQMGLQRGQQGLGYAQASDTGTLNRGQGIQASGAGIQSLTGQMDQERMQREQLQNQINNQVTSFMQNDRGFDLQAAQAADATRLARLQGMGNLAGQNDAGRLAMLNAGQGAAYAAQGAGQDRMAQAYGMGNQQDQQNLQRTMMGLQAGQMTDQGRLADWQMRGNLANMTDTTGLGRQMAGFNAAQGLDATNYQRLGQYMQGAGQADATQLARLGMQAGLAGQMQDAQRQRYLDTYGMLYGAGQGQAGNAYNWGALGMGAYGDAYGNSINAYNNAAGLRGMGQTNAFNQANQLVGMGVGAAMGRPPSGGGGGGGGGPYYGQPGWDYSYEPVRV